MKEWLENELYAKMKLVMDWQLHSLKTTWNVCEQGLMLETKDDWHFLEWDEMESQKQNSMFSFSWKEWQELDL